MNYKEKYNAALERARILTEKLEDTHIKGFIYHIFPELKESKDERIRKELIEFIKRRARRGCYYDYDKWIAWLEKQRLEL